MAAEQLTFTLEIELYRLNAENQHFWTQPTRHKATIETSEAKFIPDVEHYLRIWAIQHAMNEEEISPIDATRATLCYTYEENEGQYKITYRFQMNRPKGGWSVDSR